MKTDNPIVDKSKAFAIRIIRMCQHIETEKREIMLSRQVLRSGTSIGANVTESRNAQSTADFIHKLNIALKEADETLFWINNLYEGGYLNEKEFESIHKDADELVKILVASIKTLKKKNGTQL